MSIYELEEVVMRLDEIAADIRYLADRHPALNWVRKLAERVQDVGDDIDDVRFSIEIEMIDEDEVDE